MLEIKVIIIKKFMLNLHEIQILLFSTFHVVTFKASRRLIPNIRLQRMKNVNQGE